MTVGLVLDLLQLLPQRLHHNRVTTAPILIQKVRLTALIRVSLNVIYWDSNTSRMVVVTTRRAKARTSTRLRRCPVRPEKLEAAMTYNHFHIVFICRAFHVLQYPAWTARRMAIAVMARSAITACVAHRSSSVHRSVHPTPFVLKGCVHLLLRFLSMSTATAST